MSHELIYRAVTSLGTLDKRKNIAAQMKHVYTVGPIHVRKNYGVLVGKKEQCIPLARSFCSPVGN